MAVVPNPQDDLRWRQARPQDEEAVLDVLDAAARWLATQAPGQWPPRFEAEWISRDLIDGHTWLVDRDGQAVGTVTLDWTDPLWAPDDGSAGYVHRLATRRGAPGVGERTLEWAASQVRDAGRLFLRLDCVADNQRLRAYYERRGFEPRGDVSVAGPPGQRYDSGMQTVVRRYEKRVSPAA